MTTPRSTTELFDLLSQMHKEMTISEDKVALAEGEWKLLPDILPERIEGAMIQAGVPGERAKELADQLQAEMRQLRRQLAEHIDPFQATRATIDRTKTALVQVVSVVRSVVHNTQPPAFRI